MEIQTQVKIIEKTSKTYSFEGRQGMSRNIRAIIDDNIYSFKYKDDEIALFDSLPSKGMYLGIVTISSPQEKPRLLLTAITDKK